jgi:ribonuclease R
MPQKTTYEGPLMVRGKGTGFFAVEGFDEDVLISPESLGFALDGDIVEIELKKKIPGKRQEGAVVRVIQSAREEIIGTVKKSKAPGFELLPDNSRIHVRPLLDGATELDEGMKVAVKITLWKNPSLPPRAKIIETLGRAGDHETEMQAIIRQGGFSENFNEAISTAGNELYARREALFADAVTATTGEHPSRRDMRDRTTMTIDPADAKDFDDALSVHTNEDGTYEIGIHIADVSYYVKENDPIDKEAQERGTSIYLVDRVIPMLPEVLSNDLCSLRPHEDRLAFSAVFTMNDRAEILSAWYGQTIIHSNRRFSYEEAQGVLDQKEGDNLAELTTLMTLGRILRGKRFEQGAIAFEQPEVRFKLDEHGKPIEVVTKVRTETMMMIEDFMLLANQKVTEHIYHLCRDKGRDAAFIYRVHDVPNPEKIEELSLFIHALGYEFETNRGEVEATEINKLLKSVEGTPEENLIKTATIRSMAKAVYSTKNIGHFGLAFKYYTHFTSPIRRYPDLMAHRMLRRHLDGSMIGKQEMLRYEKLAIKSSAREIEAVKAERDSIKFKQVEYMLDKVGQEFAGIITGVTDWGIYVEEKESKAEGMVRLASIKGDYFVHEASKYRVRGDKTGRSFTLGQEVRFKIIRADLQERQLDFELVEAK